MFSASKFTTAIAAIVLTPPSEALLKLAVREYQENKDSVIAAYNSFLIFTIYFNIIALCDNLEKEASLLQWICEKLEDVHLGYHIQDWASNATNIYNQFAAKIFEAKIFPELSSSLWKPFLMTLEKYKLHNPSPEFQTLLRLWLAEDFIHISQFIKDQYNEYMVF